MEAVYIFWNTILFQVSADNHVTVGDAVLVALLLAGAFIFVHFLQFVVARRLKMSQLQPDVVVVIKRISYYLIFILVALTVLSILGIPIAVFAFATGAIAIGVGFGAQNIINNFISGWILIAERPIRLDDFIELEGAYGVVEEVGTRSTRIRRSDGVRMLVPNSKLLENTVVNWTLIDKKIRTSVRVGIAYGSDIQMAAKLLEEIVSNRTDVLKEPEPEYIFEDFGDSALILDAYFWCDVSGEKSLRSIRSDIRYAIAEAFEQNNIVVAFPQRDIHLHTGKPIAVAIEQVPD